MGLQGCSEPQILVGLRWLAKVAVFSGHEHEIARGHIRRLGPRSKMNADRARKLAVEAAREADRAEAPAWSLRMEGFGGPAQPSPTVAECLNGRYGWLEVECHRCKTRASISWMPSADPATRQSGNWRRQSNAGRAERRGIQRRSHMIRADRNS
jgi:hypothetical protein